MKPAFAFVLLLSIHALSPLFADDQPIVLKADGQQRWLKGNMHTHSYWSDGDNFPEMIAGWYKEHGYQFLVFTDHNTLHNKEKWVSIAKAKNGEKAFDALRNAYTSDWIVSRETEGKTEIRLKTFNEVFDRGQP